LKRLDRLVLGELFGPWGFGVAIFTVLIMAGTYLFKMTDYVVQGIPVMTILKLTGLLLPGVMVKTFSMAVLLATLLAFGRLSSDSEIVALRAAGASIGRIMAPVGVFGILVAAFAFWINETVVPWAAYQGFAMKSDIEKTLNMKGEPIFHVVNDPKSGKPVAMISALDFNLQQRSLSDVWVHTYVNNKPSWSLHARKLHFTDANDWSVEGEAKVFDYELRYPMIVKDIWPSQINKPPKLDDIAASRLKDLDGFSMPQMKERIRLARLSSSFPVEQIRNLEYGYWNKLALPMAAIVFGLVGAPLGIRNHRTGAAAGFWLSVMIIFAYMTTANFMAQFALGGKIPAWGASFAPILIGVVFAAITIHRKNV
jgi:lipopolysaccharide export system permease protein